MPNGEETAVHIVAGRHLPLLPLSGGIRRRVFLPGLLCSIASSVQPTTTAELARFLVFRAANHRPPLTWVQQGFK
jgi:hypothetical protein